MWSWDYRHGRQVCGREELSSERFLSLPQCFLLSRSRQVRHFVAAVATSTDGVFELALEVVAETPGELGDGFVEAGGRVIALRLLRDAAVGHGHEQLDPVELVRLAAAGIVVHRHEVGVGPDALQFFEYALARNVVGQAAERLEAQDVAHPVVDEFQHFRREQPAFPA